MRSGRGPFGSPRGPRDGFRKLRESRGPPCAGARTPTGEEEKEEEEEDEEERPWLVEEDEDDDDEAEARNTRGEGRRGARRGPRSEEKGRRSSCIRESCWFNSWACVAAQGCAVRWGRRRRW